jgi:hypothetical protein
MVNRGVLWGMATVSVATFVVGSVTVAHASNSTTIHACESKGSHDLHLGKCKRGETKVEWNQRGAQGAPGTAGPSDVYLYDYNVNAASGTATGPPLDGSASGTLLTLPAGRYLMHYVITMDTSGGLPNTDYYSCTPHYSTSGSAAAKGGTFDLSIPAGSGAEFGVATMDEPLVASATTRVAVSCLWAEGTQAATVFAFDISATKTGTLHTQGVTGVW